MSLERFQGATLETFAQPNRRVNDLRLADELAARRGAG